MTAENLETTQTVIPIAIDGRFGLDVQMSDETYK
jgi:hypothetical protein